MSASYGKAWCSTCGKDLQTASATAIDCPACAAWWVANPPPDEIARWNLAVAGIDRDAPLHELSKGEIREILAAISTPSTTHGVGERDAVLEEAARVAEEYPSNDGFAIPVVRGIAQAIRTLKSTTSGERSPTRAEDEALRTAHQSSTTLVEYLDTPPNIGTADQAIDYALHLHCKPPHA